MGLSVIALVLAWFSGFGMAYGQLQAAGEDREIGKWIGRYLGLAAIICAALALTVKR